MKQQLLDLPAELLALREVGEHGYTAPDCYIAWPTDDDRTPDCDLVIEPIYTPGEIAFFDAYGPWAGMPVRVIKQDAETLRVTVSYRGVVFEIDEAALVPDYLNVMGEAREIMENTRNADPDQDREIDRVYQRLSIAMLYRVSLEEEDEDIAIDPMPAADAA